MEKIRFYGLYCNKLSVKIMFTDLNKNEKKKTMHSCMKAMYVFISIVR